MVLGGLSEGEAEKGIECRADTVNTLMRGGYIDL